MYDTYSILITFGLCYGLASIPVGVILTRIMGLGNLKEIGSGNIGATNVLRTGNKTAAALTLIFDAAKGIIAVTAVQSITNDNILIAIAAAASVIGHCFPIWLKFRGGKGVATGLGVIVALNPLAGIAAIIIWIATALLFKRSSVSSLIVYLSAPAIIYLLESPQTQTLFAGTVALIAMISTVRHKENIKRIIKGTEPRIKV